MYFYHNRYAFAILLTIFSSAYAADPIVTLLGLFKDSIINKSFM